MKRGGILLAIAMLTFTPLTAHAVKDVSPEIRQYAEELGPRYYMCPETIEAVVIVESSGDANAINKAGTCHGAMQVNPLYHGERMKKLGVTDLHDLYGGMLVGTDFLADLCEKYDGDICAALMAYNGSKPERIERYFETGEVTGYVEKVLKLSAELERMHGY